MEWSETQECTLDGQGVKQEGDGPEVKGQRADALAAKRQKHRTMVATAEVDEPEGKE